MAGHGGTDRRRSPLALNLAALLVDQGATEPDEDGTLIAGRLDRIETQLAALTYALSRPDNEADAQHSRGER